MLSQKYRYVGLDFETTGLDLQKDEPIQLGIVEVDYTGKVIDEYQTLIRPEKEIKELKNIVSFITHIDIDDLAEAPTIEEVLKDIQHFFSEDTVVIGHNISFDLSFLNRFFPSLIYAFSIDTFQLSQAMVPYAPSYALEILSQYLEEKSLFLQRKSKFGLSLLSIKNSFLKSQNDNNKEKINKSLSCKSDSKDKILNADKGVKEIKFHDAFYDTKETLTLFCYLINFLHLIQENTPIFSRLLQKSDCDLIKILPLSESTGIIGQISLPPLKKFSPADTSFTTFPYDIQLSNYENHKRFYTGNLQFKALLQSLLANKKILLVFSSKPKLDIAKNLLNEMGIKNIGFAREEQTISASLFQAFLNKQKFSDFEILFIIKYCVHLFYGYGVLDLNSKGDYKVYGFIKDVREIVKYPLVLTTHNGLYSIIEKQSETYKDFQIVFFDVEWRYRNYNQYLSRTCDLYYIQNFVDMLLYKYELLLEEKLISSDNLHILQEFDTFFTMFIGILRTETKKLFINRSEDEIQINPIASIPDFYQTNILIPKLKDFKTKLEGSLQSGDFKTLWSQIGHFISITETVTKVQRKMYNQSDFYFLYSEDTKFTNRDEFLEIFTDKHTIFLSNHEKTYLPLLPNVQPELPKRLPHLKVITDLEKMLHNEILSGGKSFFIISTVKDESREIFEYLQKIHDLEGYQLLVENITGGAGKNIYKAQKNQKKMVVGGYNFLMMCYAQKIEFDQIIIRNIKGAQSDLILSDILRFAPEK